MNSNWFKLVKATIVSFIMSIFVIYIHANNLSYYGIAANGRTVPNIVVNLCGGGSVELRYHFSLQCQLIGSFGLIFMEIMQWMS